MEIILSQTSSKPIYEQIVLQMKAMIMNGQLKPQTPLPSMRKLAKDLHVSIITTQRAYDELSKDGFIVVVPAKGAFVSTPNQDSIREENLKKIKELLKEAYTLTQESGFSKDFLLKLIEDINEEN